MTNTVPESVWYNFTADDLCNDAASRESIAWKAAVVQDDYLREFEQFVAQEMGGGRKATYVNNMNGSFNMIFHFRLDDGKQLVLRLPVPGSTVPSLTGERIENEVSWMQYFEDKAIAKVPHVHSWSASVANAIGCPFILMDFVNGKQLVDCVIQWFQPEERQRRSQRMQTLYEDIAALYLEMDRHHFDRIGSIARDDSGAWAVTRRPLTHDMHMLLLDMPDLSTDGWWPTGPLESVAQHKSLVDQLYRTQRDTMRSINIPGRMMDSQLYYHVQRGNAIDVQRALKTARGRVLARHALQDAASLAFLEEEEANQDGRPFRIFNPDLCGRNILVDPETGHISGLIDFEYTNAMPAALAHCPPIFIMPYTLDAYLKRGQLADWLKNYNSFFPVFVKLLHETEEKTRSTVSAVPLSAKMQASFANMSWLVRYAYSFIDVADIVYWEQRHLFPPVDKEGLEPEIREYQEHTERQISSLVRDRKTSKAFKK